MESDQMESRKDTRTAVTVCLRKFLSCGITSCASIRPNDSQDCTADVTDTPSSPKEKLDDLIGPDIDPVGDHYDLRAEREAQPRPVHEPLLLHPHWSHLRMSERSTESSDSGVSLKSGQSKDELLYFKDRVSPRLADSSPSEEEHDVSDDEDLVKSPDDQGRETNQEVGCKHLEAPVSSCS